MERRRVIEVLSEYTEEKRDQSFLNQSYDKERLLRQAIAHAVRLLVYDERVMNEQQGELCMLKGEW